LIVYVIVTGGILWSGTRRLLSTTNSTHSTDTDAGVWHL